MTHAPDDIIGEAASYDDVRRVLRERRQALGLTHLQVDEIAGLQSGYTGKLEIATKNYGPMSLGSMLGALGVKIVFVPAAGKQPETAIDAKASLDNLKTVRKKLAAKGGRARAMKLSSKERRVIARKAARAKWRNWRLIKAEKERRPKRAKKQEVAPPTD